MERQTAGAEKVLAAELAALRVGGAQSHSTIGALGCSRAGACCSQRILETPDLNHSTVPHGFEGKNYIIVTRRFPSGVPWRKDLRPGRWPRALPAVDSPAGREQAGAAMCLPRFSFDSQTSCLGCAGIWSNGCGVATFGFQVGGISFAR
jgi:hypothetical protein